MPTVFCHVQSLGKINALRMLLYLICCQGPLLLFYFKIYMFLVIHGKTLDKNMNLLKLRAWE